MTVEDAVVFSEAAWKQASSECKDLLIRLLHKEPASRLTLEKAVKHKFFDSVRKEFVKE